MPFPKTFCLLVCAAGVLLSGCNKNGECDCVCQSEAHSKSIRSSAGETSAVAGVSNDSISNEQREIPEADKIAAESANIQGLELMRAGGYTAAHKQFLLAIARNPIVPDFHNNAGIALLELDKPLDAKAFFDDTIAMNPALPQPYMNMGRCYAKLQKSAEAQAWYKKAIEHDRKGVLWEVFWMMGKDSLAHGDHKLACQDFEQARAKAEQLRIRNPKLFADLAGCHFELQQYLSAWHDLAMIRFLGAVPDADLSAKVRAKLKQAETDPDENERIWREQFEKEHSGYHTQ